MKTDHADLVAPYQSVLKVKVEVQEAHLTAEYLQNPFKCLSDTKQERNL